MATSSKSTSSKSTRQIFKAKLTELTVDPQCHECPGCGSPYIQVERFQTWLKEKCSKRSETTWADQCLDAANQEDAGSLSLSDINAKGSECLLVFSILYDIGAPEQIQYFQRKMLTDSKLPISLLTLQNELEQRAGQGTSRPEADLARRFNERQWAFCPARFDWSSSFDCKKRTVLPICKRALLSTKGGTALLWQIAVQEEFVGQLLRTRSANSRFNDIDFGMCYQFALKTFRQGYAEIFEEERTAFFALRDHPGMISYLGDFLHPSDPSCQTKQRPASNEINDLGNNPVDDTELGTIHPPGDVEGTMTYNIVLELGESDLEEFFLEEHPPVLRSEVKTFWEELLGVAEALGMIHNFTKPNGQEFDGWHADIKPDNILRVQSGFKLSDPGFAKFVHQKPNNTTRILGGTSTYGAPEWERSRKSGASVSQSIDIWSLGCVFSMAATWVAFGHKGLLVYQKLRGNAIKTAIRCRGEKGGELRYEADSFHDGSDVLGAIKDWHMAVLMYLRATDTMTSEILDLVTDGMLRSGPADRLNITSICDKLHSILQAHSEQDEFQSLLGVQEAFEEVQVQSLSRLAGTGPESKKRSELFCQVPEPSGHSQVLIRFPEGTGAKRRYNGRRFRMKSLASEYFTGSTSLRYPPPPQRPKPRPSQIQSLTVSASKRGGISQERLSPTRNLRQYLHSESSSYAKSAPITYTARTSESLKYKPQDVFQARYELEEATEQKRNLASRFKDAMAPNNRKDPLLAEFFENRDLIFVADNAPSMSDHWPQATELLDVLVRKARNLDENGIDLYFTHENGKPNAVLSRGKGSADIRAPTFPKVNGKNHVAKFKEAMRTAKPGPSHGAKTDLSMMLGFLLDKYITHLEDFGIKNARKQTIIVLTDGNWELDKVSATIEDFVFRWSGLARDRLESRSICIQFVQFGNDPDATRCLQYLDNKLLYEGTPDIVDTEPSLGDVYKMLIGSLISRYDQRSSVVPSSTASAATKFPGHDMYHGPASPRRVNNLPQVARASGSSAYLQPPLVLD